MDVPTARRAFIARWRQPLRVESPLTLRSSRASDIIDDARDDRTGMLLF
jgi:hypothetical protein